MTWQDLVFTAGLFAFIIALIPTIRTNKTLKRCDIPYITSFLTAFWQGVFTVLFLTLSLYLSALTDAILAIMWSTILLQKWYYRKKTISL